VKLAELTDEELGSMVRDGFRRLHARRARDMAGNVASSKEIEDDPPDFTGEPPGPDRPGASVARAQDAALEDLKIRQRGSPNMDAELHLARVKREYDPAANAAVSKVIPGYGRLK
jgi:hypothetical protein